jgi:hypothetical protein
MRSWTASIAAFLLVAACGGGESGPDVTRTKGRKARTAAADEATGVPATRTKRLDLASCFAEDLTDEAAASTRCPSFALLALDYMGQECAAVGGSLKPLPESVSWSLDVDGDASAEVLVDLAENIDCEGAPGVFSCGSLGCPFLLYKKRGDTWVELGAINADDAPAIEVLPRKEGSYASLRGGCTGMRPCSELTHYEWQGDRYERSWIDYKGHAVDVAPGGLMTLTQDAAILDGPKKNANPLDEYPVGTAVVVLGTAREGPYQLVSPCNACRRGFVETALLEKR